MKRILAGVLTASLASTAAAQDETNTILVLDGSGSMWGQIEGIAKITIAQDVVAGILADFPADQGLGLTVYGHRERGNCTDIETIVSPAPGTVPEIIDAVNGISPLGRTPMTDSVIAAAEALRYTENAATVILVSDGVETCNPDPCAAARLLEEAGIDFTTHVVGFDVDDPEALAQMQCIAEETGGQFVTASNAEELDLAMTAMVMAEPEPEPEPVITQVTFEARIGSAEGPLITGPVLWEIEGSTEEATANPAVLGLEEGSYTAAATWLEQETTLSRQFIATGEARTLAIVFEEPVPAATVIGPDVAIIGSTVEVGWSGPDEERDYIAVASPDETGYVNFAYTADGSPVNLLMPPTPGQYELRYIRSDGSEVLATAPITIDPAPVSIVAPETAIVGESIEIGWTGPGYDRDYISVGEVGSGPRYINFTYTDDGAPLMLEMPTEPGDYEIRYQLSQGGEVLTTVPISVTEAEVSIVAPETATVGESVEIDWTGPGYDRDYISVGEVGSGPRYINYTYTDEGSPLMLEMPTEPGDYEIRYQLSQGGEVLTTVPISVTEAEVSILAPETATVGEPVEIGWTGPGYNRDYISVGEVGSGPRYINYTYTDEGSPLMLAMPTEPGDYEVRYQLSQGGEVLHRVPISVTAAEVSIVAPQTATIGENVEIGWTGPGYNRDYISVGEVGSGPRYINYTYTDEGSPLMLEMPAEPGDYEIRYQLSQGGVVIARVPLTVTTD